MKSLKGISLICLLFLIPLFGELLQGKREKDVKDIMTERSQESPRYLVTRGSTVIELPRELTLEEIKEISDSVTFLSRCLKKKVEKLEQKKKL